MFFSKKQKNPQMLAIFPLWIHFGRDDSPFFIIIWRLFLLVLLDFQYCILRKLSYIKCWIYSSSSLGFPSFSHSFDSIRLRDMEMSGKLHCMKQLMAEGEKCSLVSRQIRYSFLLSFNLIFAKDGIIPSRVSSKLSQVSSVIFSWMTFYISQFLIHKCIH